ncbi:hypothetical protein H310_00292 [Aphanomyces invadans]|uniref:Folate-Biopterin Transporter (FBT) Family n=1 Tax=Aphanomyces invadans TaxID=157072 RepID=A0A024UV72_9STRA|nr:hypothetical protein H310_00292 [Aphanomyces invadans]ETW09832.1 hypothetical protein H310_00292 [Aphanomyces invadans]|eukprot:XP_008861243.1 hypothetical protein H310_00292 [Aphanomyces invadans]
MDPQHVLEESVPLVKATSSTPFEGDALLPGGPQPLNSLEILGLLAQFGAVGFIFTLLPALNYPIFNVYLQMEGYQTASYGVLVSLGWSFKVNFGMLSDCVPILGYRRKSWMVLGWSVCFVSLAIMAFLPVGAPYCNRQASKYCRVPLAKVPEAERRAHFNLDAPDQGSLFILLSMVASIGYIIAECASDAMIIQYAQREPLALRGRVQTASFTTRYLCGIPALLVTAFGLNGIQYNGTFSFSVSPNVPYAISLVPCLMAAVAAIVLVREGSIASAPITFTSWWRGFWSLLQQQAMWQVCFFKFLNGFFRTITATPLYPIKATWANVAPLTDALSTMVGNALFCAALLFVGRYGLHWNWRWSLVAANVSILVLDATVILCTTWDVVRNQWFFAGVTMSEQIPNGMIMIIGSFCAVEMADVGTEGATYGLLTSLANLTYPLSSAVYKYIDSYFFVAQNDIKTDSDAVRWDVTSVYAISYGCKLVALVPLVLLPPQKPQLQELKRRGVTSSVAGALVLVVCGCSLVFSLVSNFLAVFPSTKCFRIAGGNGIVGPDGYCL